MPDFKVKFNNADYLDIAPREQNRAYIDGDLLGIINYKDHEKGNIDKCIWQRHIPTAAEIASPTWRGNEVKRILKTGVLIAIKDEVMWLPPNYYFALQYGRGGSSDLQFRIKRLKHVYFKIRARNNQACKGTMTIKNRGDGETTMAITDAFWECLDGNTDIGQMGIQSKTRNDCINPCWSYVQTLWQSLDGWIKKELCSDFASGGNIQEKLTWKRDAMPEIGKKARNVLFAYYASGTTMDGKHDMKKCILDEICKWLECSFYDVFTNYSKFIMPGFERRGLFDMFSSPADKDCKSSQECKQLWDDSNTDEMTEMGTTKSQIHRYYSNPLEGIHGAYDKWGDADPDQIYAHIMRERAKMPKDKLMGEIRGFPLNEEEMWESVDANNQWTNVEGIKERKIYLLSTKFKDPITKEPTVVYGNLERVGGYIDGEVEFRQADVDKFDINKARFAFSYLPQNNVPLKNIFKPPSIVENCLGIDPFNHRYPGKDVSKQSNGAMVNRKFRDLLNTGIYKVPTMIYCCRPTHQDIFFEDALKAAIFNRALIQYENRSDKFANYAEDRGYFAWLLPEIGAAPSSTRKGDAPSGKGKFLDEGMALIDSATNTPINPEDPYYLEKYWFWELLDDYLKFNQKDTHLNDLTMADIQALMGAIKIMYKKIRKPSDINESVMDYLLG